MERRYNMNFDFTEEMEICTHYSEDSRRFCGAVVPPIFQNSLFAFEDFEDLNLGLSKEKEKYVYSRGTNPTVEILENKLAALEHGEACKCFSSGMAAISSAIGSCVKTGDHILFVNSIYGPALKFAEYMKKYGVEYDCIDVDDSKRVEEHIKNNTKLIYVESPGTMTFRLLDLNFISDIAKKRNIITAIDNTWATPLFQKPIDFGIDISIHSCTKYIGGHSDVVAGAVITSEKLMKDIFEYEYMLRGGCLGPFEGWLLLRGLRTLPIRMQKHQENALLVAEFLSKHKNVKKVYYPGLKSNPDYELSKKQLKGYSGLMSFEIVSGKYSDIEKVINSCRLFKIGVSWGGFESLILSPNHGDNADELKKKNFPLGLIRISVGLESADKIIEDLDRALNNI